MFSRWGAFVYRHRRIVLVLAVALGLAAASVAGRSTSVLSAGGYLDPRSESQVVTDRLAADFGQGRGNLILIYAGPAGSDATSAAFQAEVQASVAGLRTDPDVVAVTGYAETGNRRFIATDGTAAYVVASLTVTDEASVPLLDRLESHIAKPGAGIRLLDSGYAPFTRDMAAQSEHDLLRAESISLPIAALVLVLVFGSLIAAAMPLLVAGLAIPSTLALVWLVGQQVQLSIYVQNVSTMLGLALAIDYSLFIVSRFREELRRGRTTGDAVSIAVATSGKAVTFSGMAVAAGLGGLLAFASPALRSFGIGGALTVFASLVYALAFLPALLGMIGPRIDALSMAGLVARIRRSTGRAPATPRESRWARVANLVMRHPIAVLVPTLAILLASGTPYLHLEQGIPGASTLPSAVQSREAADMLTNRFEAGTTMPIVVLVDVPGDPSSAVNVRALTAYAAKLAAVAGIGRVEGPFSGITNPASGQALTTDQLAMLYAQPRSAWPAALGALWDRYVKGSTVRMDAISPIPATTPEGTDIVPLVRAVDAGAGFRTQVGGFAAIGYDFLESQASTAPVSVAIVLLAMGLIVYLLFGSVVLPLKAVVMTMLSITASFGALIWIFQDGHLSDVLGFQSPGFTMAGVPVIMFCVIFGLSMDYEVLLLSRVQEAWRRTGDNTASVAEGLARTAGVITGAAAIMISVFIAFSLAESLTIKGMGVGMAIAVFVDASIVRVLVVPATMRLLGRWNWWAPGPLAGLADRLGFSHVDDGTSGTSGAPA